MVVQHNLAAMNSHRTLGINNAGTSKNLEKLSSGYRINRAGDDAAGLAISEKMRGQIRGLSMAEQNTENGVSLIQTAEGGLNETHAILQRMRELAVQSSNGTYDSEVDRKNLDKEFQAIKSEIDRISESTHYNGIKLLNGNLGAAKINGTAGTASSSTVTLTTDMTDVGILGGAQIYNKDGSELAAAVSITITNNNDGTFNISLGSGYNEGTIRAGDGSITLLKSGSDTDYIKINLTGDAVQKMGKFDQIGLELAANGKITQSGSVDTYKVTNATNSSLNAIGLANSISFAASGSMSVTVPDGSYKVSFEKQDDGSYVATMGNISARFKDEEIADGLTLKVGDFQFTVENANAFKAFDKLEVDGVNLFRTDYGTANKTVDTAYTIDHTKITTGAGNGLVFQIGANGGDDQRVKLFVDAMDSNALGLQRGDIKSDGKAATSNAKLADASIASIDLANEAIDTITGATNMVSAQRAGLGALQNRLEHTLNNLGVTKENLTAAESSIRDVDMAEEMMDFTKNNILVQASQAMLAQANQLPQGVLSLLR